MAKRFASFSRSFNLWSKPNQVLLGALLLSSVGLLFVFEASVAQALELFGDQYHFVKQQAYWLGAGSILMLAASLIPPKTYRALAPLAFFGSLGVMLLVFVPGVGKTINGAQRWINVAGFSLQPVELLKLGSVLYFADWLTQHQRWRPFMVLTGIPVLLLLLQPDLGSALILISTLVGMYFLAGGSIKKLFAFGGLGIAVLAVLIMFTPYRRARLMTFLNPAADPLGAGFHTRQITLALGSGGWFGQGIGKSRQKFAYIPEVSNDSIFAIVAEETGFFGSLVVIGLFGWFIRNLFVIMRSTEEKKYHYLLASGITIWISTQVLLNLSAVVILVPLTGIPLPFFSYGGSALVMLLLATGILTATARYS